MFNGLWCMFFGHDWRSYRPVNAKNGDTGWYCNRCGKEVSA